MGYHGRFEQHKQPKKKRGLKIFLIILAVILVIGGAAAAAVGIYYNRMMNKMNIIELPEDTYVYTEETQLTEATEAQVDAAVETAAATEATTIVTEPPKATAEDVVNILHQYVYLQPLGSPQSKSHYQSHIPRQNLQNM